MEIKDNMIKEEKSDGNRQKLFINKNQVEIL